MDPENRQSRPRCRPFPSASQPALIIRCLLDLRTDRAEVFRRPTAAGYAETRVFVRGDELAPAAVPDLRVTVDELLG